MPGRDKIKKSGSDFGDGFIPKKKDKSDFSGPNKGPRNKSDFANKNKSKTKIAERNDKSDFSGGNKFTPKTGGSKTKPKVVTPAMIKAKGFTTLRDYLNDRDGKKRRDGKKVVLIPGKTKTAKTKTAKTSNDAQSTQKVISKKTQTDFKKSGAFKGTDAAPQDNKKAKKKSSFFDSIGSGIKKAIKETKRNAEGDFKKKTGRYKLISKGTSNIIGSKKFVSDKKKKK